MKEIVTPNPTEEQPTNVSQDLGLSYEQLEEIANEAAASARVHREIREGLQGSTLRGWAERDEQTVADARRARDHQIFEGAYAQYIHDYGNPGEVDARDFQDKAATNVAHRAVHRDHLWHDTYAATIQENPDDADAAAAAADAAAAAFDADQPTQRVDRMADLSRFGLAAHNARVEASTRRRPSQDTVVEVMGDTDDSATSDSEPVDSLAGSHESNPEPTSALSEKLAAMEDALQNLAAAKKAVEMGVGRGRQKKEDALQTALEEVRHLIGAEALSDGEKTELKLMALERVSEIQIENAEVPGRFAQAMQRVGNSRVMQYVKRHKVLLYGSVAAVTVTGAAIAVATGGAGAAAIAAGIGLGAAKGGAIGTITGGSIGTLGARVARRMGHTAEATRARNEQQLAGFAREDGETYEDYAARVDAAVAAQAGEMYTANTHDRRRTAGKAALQGAIGGAVMGGAMGGIHSVHWGGAEVTHAENMRLVSSQTHDIANHIPAPDPHQNIDVSHMGDLSRQAAGAHHGETLWHATQNGSGSEHLSVAATHETILDGMSKLHDAGFHIQTHGAIHWDGNTHHYVTTGDNWSFGNHAVQAPDGGAYIMGPDGQVHAFTGTLNNGQQAALLDLLHQKGSTMLSHDQVTRASSVVSDVGDELGHGVGDVTSKMVQHANGAHATVGMRVPSPGGIVDLLADAGAASVAATASMAPERTDTSARTAVPVSQPPRPESVLLQAMFEPAEPAEQSPVAANEASSIPAEEVRKGIDQIIEAYNEGVSGIEFSNYDDEAKDNTRMRVLRAIVDDHADFIDKLGFDDWNQLLDELDTQTGLDDDKVVEAFKQPSKRS